MPDDQQRIAELQFNVGLLFGVVSGLTDFGAQIIAHGRKSRISRRALQRIKESCITNLKGMEAIGLPMEVEAHMIGKMIEQFENWADQAIERGWEVKD
jgi:hypothetical protein